MVSIAAFQAVDLGSIPGQRMFFELCICFFVQRNKPCGKFRGLILRSQLLVLLKHKEVVSRGFIF